MKQICTRCIYDEQVPGISFDDEGICNYCQLHDSLNREYPTGEQGRRYLEKIAEEIRVDGRGKKYDVIVGVSGGCDSSYLLHLAKELGLRPLAAHFDNTWDSTIAVENIQNVLSALDVDLYTYVVDNKEYDDIYRAFMKAGVPDIEAPTDIGLATTLYLAAEKYKINYMFEGHAFRTEGISPLGWLYMDGKYIESVHNAYGTLPMKTYPNLWLKDFIKWTAFRKIKKIRPLYYLDYNKQAAMDLLTEEMDWQWYGGHHLENRFTAFYHSYFMPQRFGVDQRVLGYAALVRSGQMPREHAIELYKKPPTCDPELLKMVKKRLGFSDEEFEQVMTQPKKSYRDFKTYKRTFERMRWFWWIMYKLDRVPKSFYMKFTRPQK